MKISPQLSEQTQLKCYTSLNIAEHSLRFTNLLVISWWWATLRRHWLCWNLPQMWTSLGLSYRVPGKTEQQVWINPHLVYLTLCQARLSSKFGSILTWFILPCARQDWAASLDQSSLDLSHLVPGKTEQQVWINPHLVYLTLCQAILSSKFGSILTWFISPCARQYWAASLDQSSLGLSYLVPGKMKQQVWINPQFAAEKDQRIYNAGILCVNNTIATLWLFAKDNYQSVTE